MMVLDVLIVAALLAALLASRVLILIRSRGSVLCCLRPLPGKRGWRVGVARYAGDRLNWIPLIGLLPRPRHVIVRRGLVVSGRRRIGTGEFFGFLEGVTALECESGTFRFELAAGYRALTGFVAWLESAPPSAHLDVA
ncbi:DUF2550 domain-containing protein [Planomonospora venezuelensis]|uniref:DUF2550 domain-containing protein n=1 Tax=Planomonospora venezuelensis TaxID=1999 RepID=A0A841D7L4_PLAVE|nr:DUF2550 domain-containing protein [Planomonospora venezuelensis]MBB5965459.1 hypothetical protein [Planomonospora venezuelensis]GIN03410.1 hypothetical protein Pve01_50680 [Planomonospora venezuelensis]